mgnify:CR=1 FL=1
MGTPPYVDGHGLLAGKVVVVTAAAGAGIGSAVATRAVEEGATVVVSDIHERRLAEAADALEALGGSRPLACMCDVRDETQVQNLLDAAVAEHGRLDVLVNNAGISRVVPAVDDNLAGFRHELAVDLVAPYELSRRAARWWIAEDHPGVVVNVGSVLGEVSGGRLRVPGYAAAKGGLHNLTRELAVQWARKGIRVNALAPGWFETEMNSDDMFHTDAGLAYIGDGAALGRGGRSHELDGALLLLASDASSYLTGHVLLVDGGWTAS